MDLSKLPRLSQTDKGSAGADPNLQNAPVTSPSQAPQAETPGKAFCPACGGVLLPRSRFCGTCGARVGGDSHGAGPEVWVGVAIGVVLLMVYPRFPQWVSSRLFKTHFNDFGFDNPDGTRAVVPYTHVPEFWADMGPALFALVLIADGIVFGLIRNRTARWIMFALTCVTTVYNLVYLVGSYSRYGLAIASAIAVIVGGYMCMCQWAMLRTPAVKAVSG